MTENTRDAPHYMSHIIEPKIDNYAWLDENLHQIKIVAKNEHLNAIHFKSVKILWDGDPKAKNGTGRAMGADRDLDKAITDLRKQIEP